MYSSVMVEYNFEKVRFLGRVASQEGIQLVCRMAGGCGAEKAAVTLLQDGLKFQTEMIGCAE